METWVWPEGLFVPGMFQKEFQLDPRGSPHQGQLEGHVGMECGTCAQGYQEYLKTEWRACALGSQQAANSACHF